MSTFRDPLAQPYESGDIWNSALCDGVTYGDLSHPWMSATGGMRSRSAGAVNGSYYTTPVWVSRQGDPTGTFVLADSVEQPGGATLILAVPADGRLAADYTLTSPDSFLALVDPDGDTVREFYKVIPVAGQTLRWTARRCVTYSLRGSSSGGVNLAGRPAGVRASLCSLTGGLIRASELASTQAPRDRIPHALSMALAISQQQRIDAAAGAVGYIWPARGRDYNAATSGHAQFYTGAIPLGAHFAIPPTVDVTTLGLDDVGLALAWALQDYGVLDTDSASSPVLYAEAWSPTSAVTQATTAWAVLYPLLRPVTGLSPDHPGGTGVARRTPAPQIAPLTTTTEEITMAGFTVTESQGILDARFPTTGGTDYVAYSADGSTETSSLARTAIGATGWAAATAADPSVKANANALTSAAATGAVVVSHAAVFSASTGGTQRTDWQTLSSGSRTLAIGDAITWAAGAFQITLT